MKPKIERLPQLFPAKALSPEKIEGTPPELYEFRKDFGGRAWTEIPPEIYNRHSDAFCLMEFESLVSYLGGFLHTSLTDQQSTACESLIYFAGTNDFLELVKHLNLSQKLFLIKTIDFLILSDAYFGINDAVRYDKIRNQLKLMTNSA